MTKSALLILDHGTTGVRACVVDIHGQIVAHGYEKVEQIYPQPGWVEHNATALWEMTLRVAKEALQKAQIDWPQIQGIGITNQRETSILWDTKTGQPIHNAIVWQCRRTSEWCDTLKKKGLEKGIQEKTGLVLDAYFSGSKIRWLLDHVPEAKQLLSEGRLKFGTVDSWILWNLSGRKIHVTDPTNASRTLLYNIHTQEWDGELLALFGVPSSILPHVQKSSDVLGSTHPEWTGGVAIPLAGNAGDQQAALYGQKCWAPGSAKSTYGTGAFLMMNLGNDAVISQQGLLTTLACNAQGEAVYALEGSIFMAGATLEWLQKQLNLFQAPPEIDPMAQSLTHNEGVYLVPAFVGLGAPYWDAEARGTIVGLTQGTGKAHLIRAALEAMAYQTREVLEAMQAEAGLTVHSLRVDGGVTRSNFLMQFLADQLSMPILQTENAETTAIGAAYLTGLAVNFWQSPHAILALPETLKTFEPAMAESHREELYGGWKAAIQKVLSPSHAALAAR